MIGLDEIEYYDMFEIIKKLQDNILKLYGICYKMLICNIAKNGVYSLRGIRVKDLSHFAPVEKIGKVKKQEK